MVMAKLFKIVLNGVDVSSYVYGQDDTFKDNQIVSSGTLKLRIAVDNIILISDLIIGKSITVQRGVASATERYIFRGEVVSWKINGALYEFEIADKLYAASRLEYDYTFDINIDTEAGVASEIVKTLFTYCGINYDATSVISTGTTSEYTLKKFKAIGKIVTLLKDLAKTYNYSVYYDSELDLGYFIPVGYIATTTILTTGTEITNRIRWNSTAEDMVNNLTVVGGEQLDWNTELFSGNASQTTFVLAAKPVDTDITISGVRKYRGTDSADPKDFTVDYDNRTINFTVAPASASNNVSISYSYYVPVKVSSPDYTSITNYGQRDNTVYNTKLLNTDDATIYSDNYLLDSAQPLTNAPLLVINNNDLKIGQKITVADTINGITKEVAVVNIKHQVPFRPDEVTVGKLEKTFIDMQINVIENIKKLQQQLSSQTDIDLQNIVQEKTVELSGYVKMETALAEGDIFYFDSSILDAGDIMGADSSSVFYLDVGVLGTDTITDADDVYTVQSLIPINSAIYEDFYSTEFKDVANSTATWGTSGSCTFTAGQIAQSAYYMKDLDEGINSVTIQADYTGSLLLQYSTDGTNWETITNNTTAVSAYNGHYLYWRATENGASTATLNRIKINYTVI